MTFAHRAATRSLRGSGWALHRGVRVIVDFHTHIFPPDVCRTRERYLERDEWFGQLYCNPQARLIPAEELVASMDASGVDLAVTFGFGWTDAGLCREANDYVIDAVARFPDRLIGFISVNPVGAVEAEKEISRCVARGMAGIGELMPDGQGFSFDQAEVTAPLAEAARHYRLPILTHTSEPVGHVYPGKGTRPFSTVLSFAERYPDVTVVCGHWGGGLFLYELMPKLLGKMKNVFYDTAASLFVYRDRVFSISTQIAPDKILFGTDYPLISHERFLRRVRAADLPPLIERAVLGDNALRVLGWAPTRPAQEAGRTAGAWNE